MMQGDKYFSPNHEKFKNGPMSGSHSEEILGHHEAENNANGTGTEEEFKSEDDFNNAFNNKPLRK